MNLLNETAYIFGDPQLDAAPGYDKINTNTGRSTRFDETVELLVRSGREAWDAGARVMLMLGDATEYKNPGSAELKALAQIMADRDWRRYIIAGNHDGAEYDVTSSSLEPLAVAAKSDQWNIYHDIEFVPEINTLMIPYIHRATPADIQAAMFLAMPESVTGPVLGAAHYAMKGAKCGPKEMVAPGDYLGPDQFKDIIGLDIVEAGHIHMKNEGIWQFDGGRIVRWFHPGSTTCCNIGERFDVKGYSLLNLGTRVRTYMPIKQPRTWASFSFPEVAKFIENQATAPAPVPLWGDRDIIRVDGTCPRGMFPTAVLEAAFKDGTLIRPFHLENEVSIESEARVARSETVTRAGGMKQALVSMVRERFPSDMDGEQGVMAAATDLALGAMRDQGAAVICNEIWPESIEMDGHRTFRKFRHEFKLGEPLLITGQSSHGKSNFSDAVFFNISGVSFKNAAMASVVPRDTQEGTTLGIYAGVSAFGPEKFRITRRIKLSPKGAASQSLALDWWDPEAGDWNLKRFNDGGTVERQARIDNLFGGSHVGLRATNFGIQKDRIGILFSKQSDRKALILDAIGLSSLISAHRLLDKRRTEASDAAKEARSSLSGMLSAAHGHDERLTALRGQIGTDDQAAATAQTEFETLNSRAEADRQTLTTHQTTVNQAEGRLKALPNTEAAWQAAVATQDAKEREMARELQDRRQTWQKADGDLKRVTKELADLGAGGDIAAAQEALRIAEQAETELTTAAEELLRQVSSAAENHRTAQGETARLNREVRDRRQDRQKADSDLKRVTDELTELGEAGDITAAQEALTVAISSEGALADQLDSLTNQLAEARANHTAAAGTATRLKTERHDHDGKDIGKCSKCEQSIDSTQIEAQIKRLDTELAAADLEVTRLRDLVPPLEKSLRDTTDLRTQARSTIATAREAVHKLELAAQRRGTLTEQQLQVTTRVAELDAAIRQLDTDIVAAVAESDRLGGLVSPLQDSYNTKNTEKNAARTATTTARDEVHKIELANQRRATLTTQQEQLTTWVAEVEAEGQKKKLELEAEVAALKAAATTALDEKTRGDELAAGIRAEIEAARVKVTEFTGVVAQLDGNLRNLTQKKAEALRRVDDARQQIARIEELQVKIAAATEGLPKLETAETVATLACKLLDPKAGLPLYLIDEALPAYEDRFNTYLDQLGKDRLRVKIQSPADAPDDLDILVDNGRPGRLLDTLDYSGGQQTRLELAAKWALADLKERFRNVKFGMTLDDEPTTGLDAFGKASLVRILVERMARYPVTIVISHEPEIMREFSYRLNFEAGPEGETVLTGAAA